MRFFHKDNLVHAADCPYMAAKSFLEARAKQETLEVESVINAARSRLREYGPIDPISLTVSEDLLD